MIIRIAVDIRFFLLVLLLVLLGFSEAFWLLSSMNKSLQFGTIANSLLNTFLFMLGGSNADFEGTASPVIATILLVMFLMFMTILMLNLLIALMGQTFSRVSENGLGFWRLELASTLLEQRHLLPANANESARIKCLYVIKYTSALKFQDVLDNQRIEAESSMVYGTDAGDYNPGGASFLLATATAPSVTSTAVSNSNAKISALEAKIDALEATVTRLVNALSATAGAKKE